MKQISVLIIFCFMANLIFAQTAAPAASGDNLKKMTFAEANALNGTSQATINGKPYSQYKAEQEALKNKQQAAPASQSNLPKMQSVNTNPGDSKETVPASPKPEAEIKAPAQKPAVQKGSSK